MIAQRRNMDAIFSCEIENGLILLHFLGDIVDRDFYIHFFCPLVSDQ
jgi:hypothetical protein